MEETLISLKMTEIDLIKNLEKISSYTPNRVLKLKGLVIKENHKEQLEILIFKGFSSSTTHPIKIDLENEVIRFHFVITNLKLYKAPLTETKDNFIRENKDMIFFLNQKNWI